MNQSSTKLKTGIIVGVIIVIGAIAALIKGLGGNSSSTIASTDNTNSSQNSQGSTSSNNSSSTPAQSAPIAPVATEPASTYKYKDGTYSAQGDYNSPGGPDSIGVTLTLKNDLITSVSATPNPGDRMSARYQDMFIASYKQYVVGKDISTLSLSKISGSSLTPIGFNDALAKIKSQAQS